MTGKAAKVHSVDRIVDANFNISDFTHRPAQIRQWFSNNVIRPAFSYLVGWTGDKAVMIRTTAAGILKVADVGSGLEDVETKSGTATGTESAAQEFTETVSKIRVIATDYDMYIRTSKDGVNWGDQIHVKADVEQTFDMTVAAFKVQRYGINNVIYEIEGYR